MGASGGVFMIPIELLQSDACRSLKGVPVELLSQHRVLVTGASGIIGTHFLFGLAHCQEALSLPVQVIAVTRQGVPDHLRELERKGYAQFIQGDMADSSFLASLPSANIIIHAATYGQPRIAMKNPAATLKMNTTATFALLDRLSPGGRFLFISSSEVYIGLLNLPFCEEQIGTTSPTHPRSYYIEGKRCGEAICNAYHTKGINAKSARLCLAYGPGTRIGDKRVLNEFIERGIKEKVICLMDTGHAKRTYCYVADAVYMMWRILLEGEKPVYNVGGTSEITIADLARLIGDILGVPVKIPATGTSIIGSPSEVRLNLDRFINEFGQVDFLNLDEGLRRTVEWQKGIC